MNHKPPPAHEPLTRERFDNLAHALHLQVEFPVGAGWATARDGARRVCTWLDVPRMVAVDGGFDDVRAGEVRS